MRRGIVAAVALAIVACKGEPPNPVPLIDRAKFEPLYRAGKAAQAATDVGVTYQQFGERLQSLATEVGIAKDRASAVKEQELVKKYDAVLAAYGDSAYLWKEQLDNDGTIVYRLVKPDMPPDDPRLIAMVQRYKLPLVTTPFLRESTMETLTKDAVRTVWAAAGKLLDEANKAYYAEEVPMR